MAGWIKKRVALRRAGHLAVGILLSMLAVILIGCPAITPPAKTPANGNSSTTQATEARWRLTTAQRQSSYLRFDVPVITAGSRITIVAPSATSTVGAGGAAAGGRAGQWTFGNSSGTGLSGSLSLYSAKLIRGAVEGPMVDQLLGQPKASSDAGSYLVALNGAPVQSDTPGMTFEVTEPMPLYLRVTVPAMMEPGEYRFDVTIAAPGAKGAGAGGSGAAAGGIEKGVLAIDVAELVLPTEPRVLGAVTTSTERLTRLFPDTFGTINATYLDRGEADHAAAVKQLDTLVMAARREGLSLFVEDLGPVVKLDGIGRLSLDWDAYDRVMQPYMDGSAFPDRLPQPVWLAPLPPRRIRDSATQLWQYLDACARHYSEKGWVGTAAFMHPALAEGFSENDAGTGAGGGAAALRAEMSHMLELHLPHDMLAVTTPDAAVPHARLWVVDDHDPRLPPAGALASEFSVRSWPWVCVARGGGTGGVKGFVWRDGLERVENLKPEELHGGAGAGQRPLLAIGREAAGDVPSVMPTLRSVWLSQGLNDSAMLGLLEKRSDPALLHEVLAGVVGRTGLTGPAARDTGTLPVAPAGYLYAGWLANRTLWSQMPSMMEKLVLANDPGRSVSVSRDDPLFLSAKLWLARARQPAARITGYHFSLHTGREGDIIQAALNLVVENPVEADAELELRFTDPPPPGDFDLVRAPGAVGAPLQIVKLGASGMAPVELQMAGHVDALLQCPAPVPLLIKERYGGATLRLPALLPVYRARSLAGVIKLDGRAEDWPTDLLTMNFGDMPLAMHYLSRPAMVAGTVQMDEGPEKGGSVRWTFDADYVYLLARCPQGAVTDERNTDWPVEDGRWWGSDGLQVQIAEMNAFDRTPATRPGRIIQAAFKPGGASMVKTGRVTDGRVTWTLGSPAGGQSGIKYGITIEKTEGRVTGYIVEGAIPRAWVSGTVPGMKSPAWRINVLRHRAADLTSTSWSGPLVNDADVGMMGLLVGTNIE